MGDYFGTESNNQGLRGISWEYAQTKAGGGTPHKTIQTEEMMETGKR